MAGGKEGRREDARRSKPSRVDRLLEGYRPGKQITLGLVTAALVQHCELLFGFHTFSDNLMSEAVSHDDDGVNDHLTARVRRHFCDEGFVDLERIYRETLQVAQAGIASAKVVQGNAHTQFDQLRHRDNGRFNIVNQGAFSDLQFQVGRRHTGFFQDLTDDANEAFLMELSGGQIHCYFQPWHGGSLTAGLAQHPFADRYD